MWSSYIYLFCFAESGCTSLYQKNGKVVSNDNWASAYLTCNNGFEVFGLDSVFCDGNKWTQTLGQCRETGSSHWCDFEKSSCDWTPFTFTVTADFEWKREHISKFKSYQENDKFPQFDHTTNTKKGHIMIAYTPSGKNDDRTLLVSPTYSANKSSMQCFRFNVFFNSGLNSFLRIYVVPASFTDVEKLVSIK